MDCVKTEDTADDIRRYVTAYSESLPAEDDEQKGKKFETIIAKSSGCFLWAVLVIRQLRDIISVEETDEVLEELPTEMEELYLRNPKILSGKTRYKCLAISIPNWTVYTMRPLTANELKDALRLDINQTMARDLEKLIPSLSGQLAFVDGHSRVQTIHQTATALLTKDNLVPGFEDNKVQDFHVPKPEGNIRLAIACLKYLYSDEVQMQKKRRKGPAVFRNRSNAICDYACSYFSQHLLRASSANDELFKPLTTFLLTNVLKWIELAAKRKRLDFVTRVAKHLKAYLDRRAERVAPPGGSIQPITGWRLISRALSANLASIFSAILQLSISLFPHYVHQTLLPINNSPYP